MVANGGPTLFPKTVFFISGVINVERTTLDYDVSVLSEVYYVRSLDAYCMQLYIHCQIIKISCDEFYESHRPSSPTLIWWSINSPSYASYCFTISVNKNKNKKKRTSYYNCIFVYESDTCTYLINEFISGCLHDQKNQ